MPLEQMVKRRASQIDANLDPAPQCDRWHELRAGRTLVRRPLKWSPRRLAQPHAILAIPEHPLVNVRRNACRLRDTWTLIAM